MEEWEARALADALNKTLGGYALNKNDGSVWISSTFPGNEDTKFVAENLVGSANSWIVAIK